MPHESLRDKARSKGLKEPRGRRVGLGKKNKKVIKKRAEYTKEDFEASMGDNDLGPFKKADPKKFKNPKSAKENYEASKITYTF